MTKKQAIKVLKKYRDGEYTGSIETHEAVATAIRLLSKPAKRRAK